jgi:GntR family transcriptional regulator
LVASGVERRTELLGKYVTGEAAQYGTQRLRAKVVEPVALEELQFDQWVLVSAALPSAQETTKLIGRATDVPRHVTTLASVLVATDGEIAPEFDGDEPKAFIVAVRTTPHSARTKRIRLSIFSLRRRSRSLASLNRTSMPGKRVSWKDPGLESGLVSVSIEASIISLMGSVNSNDGDDDATLGLVRLDRSDPTLLHEQVAAEIRRAISDGEANPGERIPQAKDLAAELGVNTNTVLRALRVLRDEGVIEMGRGRSIRVTGKPERGVVVAKMKELVDVARQQGYRRDELVAMLENLSSQ